MSDKNAGGSMTQTAHDGPIADLIRQHVSNEEWEGLTKELGQIVSDPAASRLARVFATVPRKIKAADRLVSLGEVNGVGPNDIPLVVNNWSLARLIRVWVLMYIPPTDRAAYVKVIEQLFIYGEVEELVALYSALPIYHYPEVWHQRCAEGVRSNMGSVRQAVLIDNYYPSIYLDENSWNQLVLKGFFTDEYMPGIIGLAKRNNEALAQTLVDFAYERAAAYREVHSVLWMLVAPYINERAFALMSQRIVTSDDEEERRAIAYAFSRSNYAAAIEFIGKSDDTKELLDITGMSWANLAMADKK